MLQRCYRSVTVVLRFSTRVGSWSVHGDQLFSGVGLDLSSCEAWGNVVFDQCFVPFPRQADADCLITILIDIQYPIEFRHTLSATHHTFQVCVRGPGRGYVATGKFRIKADKTAQGEHEKVHTDTYVTVTDLLR